MSPVNTGRFNQGLSWRVKRIKEKLPVTTEDAVYLIAQLEGIILSKYLDRATVENIRRIHQQYMAIASPTQPENRGSKQSSKQTSHRVVYIYSEFKESDPLLTSKVLLEAKDMAAVFPLMYVLENSLREFIRILMEKHFGNNWWQTEVSTKLQKKFSDRMSDDEKNSWHQRRGSHPLNYLDLDELPSLVHKLGNRIIPDIIPSIEWLNGLISEVYRSRCVLCHMNPLDKTSIQRVRLRYTHWQRQVRSVVGEIKP
jgi:hypothetical protein